MSQEFDFAMHPGESEGNATPVLDTHREDHAAKFTVSFHGGLGLSREQTLKQAHYLAKFHSLTPGLVVDLECGGSSI